MFSSHDETVGREERIGEIIACYLDACEAGEAANQQEILARHPEFENELKEYFTNEAFVRGVFSPKDAPPCFGDDYQVLGEIGRGGMGIVYRSHQKSLDKVVAIKTITGGPFTTARDIERIQKEAQRAAGLRHPNIVTVHQVAEHQGQHFFVMEYIEGQSLAELVGDSPLPSAQAAQYVKTIAGAIHHAHQRQILHCDLKPANILVDDEEKPYVTDFGLAKRMGENARYLPTSAVGGTASYMAPEQVVGDELTTATDVYGLGAILYTLLTGSPPFRAKTLPEILIQVRDEFPNPPSKLNPEVDKDLEAICLKCLSKDRSARYASADALRRDLERYDAEEETTARPWRQQERAIRWCRRRPAIAGLLCASVVIAIVIVATAVSAAFANAREANSFAARDQARAALLQLREWSRTIEAAAVNPALLTLVERDDKAGLLRYVKEMCDAQDFRAASCAVLNADGYFLARDGEGEPRAGPFIWRDYFQGSMAHEQFTGLNSVHISKVYQSSADGLYKFAISAPVHDRLGKVIALIWTSVPTDAELGLVHIEDSHRRVAVVASTESGSRVILFHPAYRRGEQAAQFPDESHNLPQMAPLHARELADSRELLQPNSDYADPIGRIHADYQGHWIAAFAPVGNTGFFVIVQERYEDVLRVDPFGPWNLAAGAVLIACLGFAVFFLFLRRRRLRGFVIGRG